MNEDRTPGGSPVAFPDTLTLAFHRGGGNSRPENTLDTFLWAWNLGAIPEGDVQYTRDGVAVMFHDPDLSRIPWELPPQMRPLRIADLDWSSVRELDVGTWRGPDFAPQRIPTLESVVAAMRGYPDRRLYLDEKSLTTENLREVAEFARSAGVVEQLYLTTGAYRRIREWMRICPEGESMLWLGYCWTDDGACDMPGLDRALDELRQAEFAGITHLNVHVLANLSNPEPFSPESSYLRALAEEMRDRGLPFQVITLSEGENPEVYRRILELGITSISTDFPEVTLAVAREYLAGHRTAGGPQ